MFGQLHISVRLFTAHLYTQFGMVSSRQPAALLWTVFLFGDNMTDDNTTDETTEEKDPKDERIENLTEMLGDALNAYTEATGLNRESGLSPDGEHFRFGRDGGPGDEE